MSATEHKSIAEGLIDTTYIASAQQEQDPEAVARTAAFATVHALIAVAASLEVMAEQSKLMTAVNLYVTSAGNLDAAGRETLRAFIASRISEFEL